MLSQLLCAIDDFLIDRIFQPICDILRRLFDWTKEAPMGISSAIAVIGFIPICADMISHGNLAATFGYLLGLWLCWDSWLAFRLISRGISDEKKKQMLGSITLDNARIFLRFYRIFVLLASIAILLITLPLTLIPKISLMTIFFSIGIVANLWSGYFQACTDLPPGKTILAKAKEWLAEHFTRPIAAPE